MPQIKRRDFIGALTGTAFASALSKPAWPRKKHRESGETDASVFVLGTAQDGGFPHIGCYCKNCAFARRFPGKSRTIASLALLDHKDNKVFLVDCTPDIRTQYDKIHRRLELQGTRRCVPDGILLTHAHIGHYTGLIFYGYEALSAEGMPVYATTSMAKFLGGNGPWDRLVSLKNIELRVTEPSTPIILNERISVSAFPVPHRAEYTDTVGFLVSGKTRRLIYIPDIQDWDSWEENIAEVCTEVDYALLDGTFFSPNELPGRDLSKIGHPFIVDTMRRLQKTSSQCGIYFTHLNHSNPALFPDCGVLEKIQQMGFGLAEEDMEFFI